MLIELRQQWQRLRLTGLSQTFDQRLQQAQEQSLSYCEWLALLLGDEVQRREAVALQQRLNRAHFEQLKTLEGMDLTGYSAQSQTLIRELACGHYWQQQRHVIIKGPVGTGKTHLAQALGHQACRQGAKVCFTRASELFRQLEQGRVQGKWSQVAKSLLAPKLLIIDDFGLRALTLSEAQDFYELVAERHLRGSMLITTNRKTEAWLELFPDLVVGNAILDRLASPAYHVLLAGDSFRRKLSNPHRIVEVEGDNELPVQK